jgi:hypothetical protein
MRVRAAEEDRMQRIAWQFEIVVEAPAAEQQAAILAARQGAADG